MKLYFENMVTTVTTLMIVSLVGFVGYSISNRSSINFWGRRSLFVLAYGLVICCFAAANVILEMRYLPEEYRERLIGYLRCLRDDMKKNNKNVTFCFKLLS